MHDKIYFLLSGCRKWERSTLAASAWLIVAAAVMSSGCSHNHLNTTGSSKTSFAKTNNAPQKEWLPIQEQRHQIVAVGPYRLPKAIPYPTGLTPLPLAIAYVAPLSNKRVNIVRIFFPASQEQAVYQWAQLPPTTILGHAPGSKKYKQMRGFKAFDPITKRMKPINPINPKPVKAPYSWMIMWIGSDNHKIFYGYPVMYFDGDPPLSLAGQRDTRHNTEYANVSPVEKELRHISMNVVL